MNGIVTALTRDKHYADCDYKRKQTQADSFGKVLTDASRVSDDRDSYISTNLTDISESNYEYACYGASISELRLQKGEMSFSSGIIGLSFVRDTEEAMTVRMDKSSTAEDPVVLVQIGSGEKRKDILVHVNEVDPKNATELEMFALLNYIDAQNGKTMAPDGEWQTYNSLRNRLEETGRVDNVTNEGNYDTLHVNWLECIQQAMGDEQFRQKDWFAESFFTEDLDKLFGELSVY